MSDKAASSLTLVSASDTGDSVYIVQGGNSRRANVRHIGDALSALYQPLDAGLTDISGLAVTDGNIIVGNGANWVAESGATARTSLGVGTGDSPQFSGLSIFHDAGNDVVSVRPAGSTSGGSASININSAFSATVPVYSFWYNGTTGIGNPAENAISIINSGAESARFDAGGAFLHGLTTALTNGDAQYCGAQFAGKQTDVGGAAGFFQFSDDTSCSFVGFFKTRSTSKGAGLAAVLNGDDVGEVGFDAADGTNYIKTGYFTGVVSDAVSSGVVPMSFIWGLTNSAGTLGERMRLNHNGHLLIGGDGTAGDVSDQGYISISATATGPIFSSWYRGATGGGPLMNAWNGFSSTYPIYSFWYNGNTGIGNPAADVVSIIVNNSEAARWDSTGFYIETLPTTATAANVYVDTATTPSGLIKRSTSSRRYKHDIRDYDKGIDELLKLRPVFYKGNNDGDAVFAGLIAEEVDEVGLKEFVIRDKEDRPDSLAYGNMIAIIIAAIKQQNAEISSVKQRLKT